MAAQWVMRGTNSGSLKGNPPTERAVSLPGADFISALTARSGCRMFTITAWQDAENPRQLLRDGAHKEAMGQFFGPDLSAGAMTSVWVPERINAMWVRCTACNNMVDFERYEGKCQCGESLPDPPPFW